MRRSNGSGSGRTTIRTWPHPEPTLGAWPAYRGRVSHRVAAADLPDTIAGYGFAYLLTVAPDGRPHPLAVTPRADGAELIVEGVGHRTADNVRARPVATLLYPPTQPDGYSLIVDAEASCDGSRVSLRVGDGVLHRPAPAQGADAPSC